MAVAGPSLLLLYSGDKFNANFYYHTRIEIDNSFLLLKLDASEQTPEQKPLLIVPKLNEAMARSLAKRGAHQGGRRFDCTVVVYRDVLSTLARYLKGKTIFFDGASLNARTYERLSRICRLKDYTKELLLKRAVKSDEEVAATTAAVRHTKELIESIDFSAMRTESDVRKYLLRETLELGLEPAFEPIVSSDENSAYAHHIPGDKKIGSVVMVDFGVRWKHYCADITRCFILDGDRKKLQQYESLENICHVLVDELPELRLGKAVARRAGQLIKRAGFPKMIHSIGHGVGLDIHELPSLGKKSDDKLAGATMAIEPAFYLKNYGMRYEETIYFDGKKARIL